MSTQSARSAESPELKTVISWGTIGVVVVAGAWTLFHIIWALSGQTADDFWGPALLVLFIIGLILAFMQYPYERASLSPATAASPQRLVSFINVVGCGTRVPNGMRQNRCQEIESPTSRHSDSKPSR